ncbi:hypothetical protein [Symbiobacterium thermophilum]|uniref:Uncharacterized protein n=1 Tax=Symbiobacterium thermophilum (strain DSM 24528 / JCM 14929 / IAM 14863 / T) TaxID=292459 RepID=Q67KF5_SYMTH|nr:hypothetical protein [Symbiobacterium thermophilum]BAD41843.1 conserved hypothetical protein [Symbiobacterium thermophilum IAM 14863]
MEEPVLKRERLWAGDGLAVHATDRADRLILEFEDETVCAAALRIQEILVGHGLATSFAARFTSRSFLIRKVQPLPVEVAAEAGPGEVRLAFRDGDRELSREEAEAALTPERLERIEDAALHAARTLRAHLSLRGVERLQLRMRFGLTEEGACLMQVMNPLECRLGSEDMKEVLALLGGA